jgi:hypothetical protein
MCQAPPPRNLAPAGQTTTNQAIRPSEVSSVSCTNPRVSNRHGKHLTHYRPPSYTARRHEFEQSYVVLRGRERMHPVALEIVDCGTEPG